MILTVTNGKDTYEIKMDSTLRDHKTGKNITTIMLFNDGGEGMSLDENSLFIMIDEYWKKHY